MKIWHLVTVVAVLVVVYLIWKNRAALAAKVSG